MPDLEADYLDPDGPISVDADGNPTDLAPEKISKEAFWVVFQSAFGLPGQILPEMKPLAILPEEEPQGRAASDSVYALLEIYYPGALMPQSETLAHLLVAGPFLVGKVLVVREIFRAKNAKPVSEQTEKEAAQADVPPGFEGGVTS